MSYLFPSDKFSRRYKYFNTSKMYNFNIDNITRIDYITFTRVSPTCIYKLLHYTVLECVNITLPVTIENPGTIAVIKPV